MVNIKYLRISPAQAFWANQSGKIVYRLDNSQYVQVKNNQEIKQDQDHFIQLSYYELETELEVSSRYQTLMSLFVLANIISTALLAFNLDSEINSLTLSLAFIWVYSTKNIITKTIKYHKNKSNRKSMYLYGRTYF